MSNVRQLEFLYLMEILKKVISYLKFTVDLNATEFTEIINVIACCISYEIKSVNKSV